MICRTGGNYHVKVANPSFVLWAGLLSLNIFPCFNKSMLSLNQQLFLDVIHSNN